MSEIEDKTKPHQLYFEMHDERLMVDMDLLIRWFEECAPKNPPFGELAAFTLRRMKQKALHESDPQIQ